MPQALSGGVFSYEAGLGSSVMVHTNFNVKEPVKLGIWGIFEVFADTMIVCTMTVLAVLTSGVYNIDDNTTVGGISDATFAATGFVINITQNYVDRVIKGKNITPMLSAVDDIVEKHAK